MNGRADVGFFRGYLALYFLVKLGFIFSGYDLYSEEAQYWVWGQYPDWSYYSKPPLTGWINTLTTVFPHHDVVVRLTALAFGIATLWVCFRLALELFDDHRIARWAVVILSASPFFILPSTFFLTDTPLLLFWLLTFLMFFRALRRKSARDWIYAGLCFGFGCLSKYAMFFFLFAVAGLWPSLQRRQGRGLLVMVVTGATLFLPVVIWNLRHDWVSVRHVNALATNGQEFSWRSSAIYILEFLAGIVGMISPFLLLLFLSRDFRQTIVALVSERRSLQMLLYPAIFTVAIFFLISVFKRTEVNWPAVTYATLPLIMASAVVRSRARIAAAALSILSLAVVAFLLFPVFFDRMGMPEVLPVKNDGLKRMTGWSALAGKVRELQSAFPEATEIFTDDYHTASELAFYTRKYDVHCLNLGRRMNQFDVWAARRLPAPRRASGIYVTAMRDLSDRLSYDSIRGQFRFPVYYRGQLLREFQLFVISDLWIHPPEKTSSF